jgi:hypothetical protein
MSALGETMASEARWDRAELQRVYILLLFVPHLTETAGLKSEGI